MVGLRGTCAGSEGATLSDFEVLQKSASLRGTCVESEDATLYKEGSPNLGNHFLKVGLEALALKQRMQQDIPSGFKPRGSGSRGTCAESEDATRKTLGV